MEPFPHNSPPQRLEEVQALIDRMPTYWAKWFALSLFALVGLLLGLGFWIRYPDTVTGEVVLTGAEAPVRLVAPQNGRLLLIAPNKQTVVAGEVIAHLAAGAEYKHILLVDSLLQNTCTKNFSRLPLPDTLSLGEAGSAYNAYYVASMHHRRLVESDHYTAICKALEQQITADRRMMSTLEQRLALQTQSLEESRDRLRKDSLLLTVHGISQKDYVERRSAHLLQESALLDLHSALLSKEAGISQSLLEIQRTRMEEMEAQDKALTELLAQRGTLANALALWKEQYMCIAPISGELEYLGFWRENKSVQAGQELFSIIPSQNEMRGEVRLPSLGAGKVEVGQKAHIKLHNYPYKEYGLILGTVASISRMTHKEQAGQSPTDVYLVEIVFPNGLTTHFGKSLPLDIETRGQADLITQPKRLVQRLFDNLTSQGER